MNRIDPLLDIPTKHIFGASFSCQRSTRCRDFEMSYMECLEAYGLRKGQTACDDYHHDLVECMRNDKQKRRVIAMRTERSKQWLRGERDARYNKETPAEGWTVY